MSRIKKKSGKGQPGISTASLPDIVFMLLFFFMAAAVMKSVEPLVKYTKPNAKAVTRFENKNLLATIKIGTAVDKKSDKVLIHLDDDFKDVTLEEDMWSRIEEYIGTRKSNLGQPDDKHLVAAIEADTEVKMLYINKIKSILRDCDQYKVTYLTNEE